MRIHREHFARLAAGSGAEWPFECNECDLERLLYALWHDKMPLDRQRVREILPRLLVENVPLEGLIRLGYESLAQFAHALYIYYSQDIAILAQREFESKNGRVGALGERFEQMSNVVKRLQHLVLVMPKLMAETHGRGGEGAFMITRMIALAPLDGLQEMLGEHAGHCYDWTYFQTLSRVIDESKAS